jgi:hypothetical protein
MVLTSRAGQARGGIIAGWREELRERAAALESGVRRGAGALECLVDRDPFHIAGYRGYGCCGRVVVDQDVGVTDLE